MNLVLVRAGIRTADALLAAFYGLAPLEKAGPDPLTPRGFDKVVLGVLRELRAGVAGKEKKALEALLSELNQDWTKLGEAAKDEAFRKAAKKYLGFGPDVGAAVGQVAKHVGPTIIAGTKAAVIHQDKLRIEPSLNAVDERMVIAAATHQALFARDEHGKRSAWLSERARAAVSQGLEEGLDRYAIAKLIRKDLGAAADVRSENYWRLIASVFTGRARSYGHLSAMGEAGVEEFEFEAVLDEVTTDVCRFMHGKTFSTGAGLAKFAEVEAAPNPEDVKDLQPWASTGKTESGARGIFYKVGGVRSMVARVDQSAVGQKDAVGQYSRGMDRKALEQSGMTTPPLHGHCRSTILPVFGSVAVLPGAPVLPAPSGALNDPLEAMAFGKSPPAWYKGQKLNGTPFGSLPPDDWENVQDVDLGEKPMPSVKGKQLASGLIIVEDDGRVWVVEPKDHFGGYEHTFPKGKQEAGLSLQQNALKEAYEEAGLHAHVTGHLGDFEKGTSVTRYYIAKRTGGAPWDAHWESTKVKLVPPNELSNYLNSQVDKKVAAALKAHVDAVKAGKPPPPPVELKNKPAKQKPPAPAAPTPSAPKPLTADDIMAQQIGGAKGSNKGGLYRGVDGVERYVKLYDDPTQVHVEHLANSMYRDLGHVSPKSTVFTTKDGKTAYASEIIPNGKTLGDVGVTPDLAKKVLRGFVGDVLTGNWDAVGMTLDNCLVFPDGTVARIDNGGTFLFRAKAGRKPDAVLNTISEWDVFFSSKNPSYSSVTAKAGVFKPEDMRDEVIAGIKAVNDLRASYGGWDEYVRNTAPGLSGADKQRVLEMLDARTKLLNDKLVQLQNYKPPPPIPAPQPGTRPPGFENARFIGKQYSTVLAEPGRDIKHLPESDPLPDIYGKYSRRGGTMPSGESRADYQRRATQATARMSPASKKSVESFTGSGYTRIRQSEASGAPNKDSKNIQELYAVCTPEPGTVYRGIHSLSLAAVEKYMHNPEFQLGRNGGETSSTAWNADVSIDSFMCGTKDHGAPDKYKILYILKQKSGVVVEHISSVGTGECEILLKRDAQFRVTGLSRLKGARRVLVLEAEEIDSAASTTPKPKGSGRTP